MADSRALVIPGMGADGNRFPASRAGGGREKKYFPLAERAEIIY
jgi:hypothetical protein